MRRNAVRLSITALCLAACVVGPDEEPDVEGRAAGCFCRLESLSPWRRDGADLDACGGDGTNACNDAFTCIDDPSDDCDPRNDRSDCFGICAELCGGFADVPCTLPWEVCVDLPDDDCDPFEDDAGCWGFCVPVGDAACEG